MIAKQSNFESNQSTQPVLQVLDIFSKSAGVSLDRLVAGRVLAETEQAVGGGSAHAWARRLVEAGESVNLRIRSVECSLREVLDFVRQGTPVAICVERLPGAADESDTAPVEVQWLVLTRAKGRRILVARPEAGDAEQWMSLRKLQRTLGLASVASPSRWIVGQPALGCQAPAGMKSPTGNTTLTPFWRFAYLIRPERQDIWVVLIFSLVVGVLALATPVAVEALVNTVAFGRYLQPVIVVALLLFTFLTFAALMRGLITWVVEIFQRRLFIRVVEDLAYRLPRVQQHQFDQRHGPEAVNRFFEVVTLKKATASLLLDSLSIVLTTVAGMIVLAFYHPFLLGFNVVLLALILLIVFGLGRGAVRTAIGESKAKYKIAAWLEELARHPTAFKLHGGSRFALERADQLAVDWLEMRRAHFYVVIRQVLSALGLQAVAATALLGLGGWLVILGELTLGQLVASELIVMVIVSSFAKLGKHLESFYDLLAAVDKLGQLFDLDVEAHDKLFHLREGEPAALSVRGVSYSYGSTSGLSDCHLELSPGESVALTGPAGSGKSTLFDLICGLRPPASGHLELDGIDLREMRPDSLRDHLAVARGIEIFHGKIEENVHLNRPNVRASDVRDALEAVGLLDEILRLPEGLNTVIQTNGAPLTQSQTVRLMLARAIADRPRLLLIDGTLDSLPDETLRPVLDKLTGPHTGWTLLVATGRSAIAESCDRKVDMGRRGNESAAPAKLNFNDDDDSSEET
jgi:ABC-type bacteriocin/lantibiotic exporter with double-glycine peptidase domain